MDPFSALPLAKHPAENSPGLDSQGAQPAGEQRTLVVGRFIGQLQVRKAVQHRRDRGGCREPGEPGAHAIVNAVAEGAMIVGASADVKVIGQGELRAVPIGRAQQHHDSGAGGYHRAAEYVCRLRNTLS